jgi:hypothetical protein
LVDCGGLGATLHRFEFLNHDLLEETTMGRFTLAVVAFVVLLAAPCIGHAGTITYSIKNYPADQNGAALSGTITTDGTIGNLATGDILSWSYTMTPVGGTPFTLTSSESGSTTSLQGTVIASPSEITVAGIPTGTIGANSLDLFNRNAQSELQYFRQGTQSSSVGDYFGSALVAIWATENPSMGGTDPWVIAVASVPEPSTFTLSAMGVVSGLACGLGRKRRAR